MLNFKLKTEKISSDKIKYFITKSDNRNLTYAEFIELLKLENNEDFLKTFVGALKDATNKLNCAFFWECLPVSRNSLSKQFAFVVKKSTAISNITQDYFRFREYFTDVGYKYHEVFPNPRKTATLIIPLPDLIQKNEGFNFKNISEFTKNAHEEQQREFWRNVGFEMSKSLESGATRWLSTSGLGVHYLHVRIDSKPKYYTHDEYKNENFEEKEDIPTPPPNPKLDTIIKNLQEAIASGDKNQLVSSIAEGRKVEEESNSSKLNSLLEAAEAKLGSADKKALQTQTKNSIADKLTKNSVTVDQLSSQVQAEYKKLAQDDTLEPNQVNEIQTMVNNNIGEVALTNLISKIKTFLTSHSVSSEQKQKFVKELTQFQSNEAASYKKSGLPKKSGHRRPTIRTVASPRKTGKKYF